MVSGTLEIILFIFVILGLIKFLFVLFSPKSWLTFAKKLYSSAVLLVIIELILAVIVLYFLLQTLTIVQIMGGVILGALLTGMTFACYAKETIAWAEKLFKGKGILARAWLPMLIWLALFVWTLVALF